MELRAYWNVIVRRWWLVLAPLAVVAVVMGATYRRPPTSYQVVLRCAAGTTCAGLSVDYDRYYPWLTSEYIANGLADVAETGVFAQAVATAAFPTFAEQAARGERESMRHTLATTLRMVFFVTVPAMLPKSDRKRPSG